jgi:two-component system, NarL family, sensor histidine kinase UhpB
MNSGNKKRQQSKSGKMGPNLEEDISRSIELSIIGQELHDNVNQVLGTVKLLLDLAYSNKKMRTDMLVRCAELVDYCINEVRQLSKFVITHDLHESELLVATRRLIVDISVAAGLKIDFRLEQNMELVLSRYQKIMFFRIIQEQLNNIIRYAKASTVSIQISGSGDFIELQIKDNGVGFDPDKVIVGVGLASIKKRAQAFGGDVLIDSQLGEGTMLMVKIPYKNVG